MTTRIIEPTQITTREEVSWTKSLADYPASLWQLNYYFRGPGTGFNAAWGTEVVADGDDFVITILASKTDDVTVAGIYKWQAWLTEIADPTNKKCIAEGRTRIVLGFDPLSVTTIETRSVARQMIEAIDAALLGKASSTQLEYETTTPAGSVKVKQMTRKDLLDARKYYAAIVANEDAAERVRNGGTFMQSIHVRMKDV